MSRARLRLVVVVALAAVAAAVPAGAVAAPPTRAEAVALGREAYRYGIPLMEFLRVAREQTSVRAPDARGDAPANTFSNARAFAGPSSRTVVAPNVDTLYATAHLDLGKGPIVLGHPAMGHRYFSFQLLDPYTNTIGYVGTRTTGSQSGRFAIAWTRRPGRRVRGVRVIRSAYRRVWVIGRTLARGEPRDLRRARALMRRYTLVALSRLRHPPRPSRRRPGPPRAHVVPGGLAFLDALGRGLAQNPPPRPDRAELRRLAAVGVGPGRSPLRAGLRPDVLDGLREGVAAEAGSLLSTTRLEVLKSALGHGGWWTPPADLGDYGADYRLRAEIALSGLGANTPAEATYPIALADSQGRLFDGAHEYRLTFRPGELPPVRAFWSLTLYDLAGYLVANPAHRYAIGSTHPPLHLRRGGSVVVVIAHARPSERGVNWLPAPAAGFRLNLRLYLPRRAALSGAWRPPPVVRTR